MSMKMRDSLQTENAQLRCLGSLFLGVGGAIFSALNTRLPRCASAEKPFASFTL